MLFMMMFLMSKSVTGYPCDDDGKTGKCFLLLFLDLL